MVKILLLTVIAALFLAPVTVQAETKKADAEKKIKKERLVKIKEKKAQKEKIVNEETPPVETAKKIELKPVDLNLEEKLLVKNSGKELKENIDLDSKYAASARKRGDVSLRPEFRMPEDSDLTRSGESEQEKEFKLKFNVGL